MTRGRELPVNSKVRRQLFPEDPPQGTKQPPWREDYLSQIIKTEYIARNLRNEVILKGMKWNFDFENEEPMNGPIKWFREVESGQWVGMRKTGRYINMRKRNRDPETYTSVYAHERSKARRLSPHSVMQRRGFFDDNRSIANTIIESEDDNFTNALLDASPPEYFEYMNRMPPNGLGPLYLQQMAEELMRQRPILPDSDSESISSQDDTTCTSTDVTESEIGAIVNPSNDENKQQEKEGINKEQEIINDGDDKGNEDKTEKKEEKFMEVNNYLNNVVLDHSGVTDDSNMIKELSISENTFENLRITESTVKDADIAIGMQEKNETTPKNERDEKTEPKLPEGPRISKKAIESEDDNFTNALLDASPPEYFEYMNRMPPNGLGPLYLQQMAEELMRQRPILPDSDSETISSQDDTTCTSTDVTESEIGAIVNPSNDENKQQEKEGINKEQEIINDGDDKGNEDKTEKKEEKFMEVNNYLNNVVLDHSGVTDDSNMIKELSISENTFENLRITESTVKDADIAIGMQEKNETTPKNERDEKTEPKLPEGPRISKKARRRLENLH